MARPVKTFETLINRAEIMLTLYDWLKEREFGKNKTRVDEKKIQDLLRTSLVISVSAFDSYFTDKFVDKSVAYLKKRAPSDDFISILEKAGVDMRAALEMLGTERPMRRIRNQIERYLDKYVTQEFSRIDDLYKAIGIKDLTKNATRKTKRKFIKSKIESGITRRHKIVHAGDLNSYDRPVEIKSAYVKERIRSMRIFVAACDEIIESATK